MTLSAADILGSDGLIARALPHYEHRPEQLTMADAVERAFADADHLLAEAGTGVGKSFAYLVPAILQANRGKRVIISTFTIALQEQLIHKDLPFLAKVLPMRFSAVLGKGRSNYLCFRRMAQLAKGRDKLLTSERQHRQFDKLADWAMDTETGERQELDFEFDETLWRRICSDASSCRGQKCSQHSRCFLQAARRKMLAADIVVVNHALFFSDLALRAGQGDLLGKYDYVVLDEAHTIESVASDHFGLSVRSGQVNLLLRELYNEETNRGLLALLGEQDACAVVQRAAAISEEFFARLSNYDGPAIARNGRIVQAEVIPDTISPAMVGVASALRELRKHIDEEDTRSELAGYEIRALELGDSLRRLIMQIDEDHAYWVTSRQGRVHEFVTLSSAPINVAPILRTALFDDVGSVVMTSATLATGQDPRHGFEYIRQRLGMADDGRDLLLASPFDYRRQATLYLETQLPEPNRLREFVPAAADAIRHYVEESQGRCFVLCTSYSLLDALREELESWCYLRDYELLAQGGPLQRSAMLDRFREKMRCVLLGTMSFWQGVDVAGEALSNVVITKLPFAVPDEPLIEARIDAIRQTGGNPFSQFQLPQAIILFKQGFGRLIRSSRDTGFVVVLDHRIVNKSYGKAFLASLPPINIVRDEFGRPQA
jgi:ATP-dependent DNA helicase DinG